MTHPALAYSLSMIFSENRFPLFRIMLEKRGPFNRLTPPSPLRDAPLKTELRPMVTGIRHRAAPKTVSIVTGPANA
jgi:hypothetical protein